MRSAAFVLYEQPSHVLDLLADNSFLTITGAGGQIKLAFITS